MALQLIDPRDKYVMAHTALPEAVIGHIRDVLKVYLMKPEYTKFYVGITQDVSRRLQQHQRTKREYKLMIPVYEETGVHPPDSFDQLEQLAIRTFGPAHGTEFTHPLAPPGRKLIFDNRRENSPPQNTLYLLIG
jgi:hypothetical protein